MQQKYTYYEFRRDRQLIDDRPEKIISSKRAMQLLVDIRALSKHMEANGNQSPITVNPRDFDGLRQRNFIFTDATGLSFLHGVFVQRGGE